MLKLSNGAKFSGTMKNNHLNGLGCYELESKGIIIKGNFVGGKLDGQGEGTFGDKSTYKGEFKDNLADGQGKIVYVDGTSYEGTFKNGKPNGRGKYIYSDGSFYDGSVVDGKLYGLGKRRYKNLTFFGYFDEVPIGYGNVITLTGDQYEVYALYDLVNKENYLLLDDKRILKGNINDIHITKFNGSAGVPRLSKNDLIIRGHRYMDANQ